jgi:prepilin-type N-terminal cleavage/methylation domain-containing protein
MTGLHSRALKVNDSGFTLVEVAMVLFIITLLLGGLVPTITAQLDQQRTRETLKRMDDIQQALLGFAMVNGRLPCPAVPTIATGAANAGVEAMNGNFCACAAGGPVALWGGAACSLTSATGVLPWVTLGLKETDAWDHRFTYRVTTYFADKIGAAGSPWGTGCTPSPVPTASSFALCSPGVPYVISTAAGTAVATDVPALFLSHGKNGYGAYTSTGSKLANGSADEINNSNGDNEFVSHTITSNFDDLVAWISPSILSNRMVTAGKLP